MAKEFLFKWNPNGYDVLKKSTNIQGHIRQYAENVQSMAGDGFVIEPRQYEHWDGYAIRPGTISARLRNNRDNILEQAWRALR